MEMKKNSHTGTHLFFIEFLIVLLFFLIISTVCLNLFVQAHTVTQEANALSFAQSFASSLAETIEGTDGTAHEVLSCFPEAVILPEPSAGTDAETIALYFDRDFHSCGANTAFYTLEAVLCVENRRKTGDITICDKDGDTLYQLSVSFYQPLTAKEVVS